MAAVEAAAVEVAVTVEAGVGSVTLAVSTKSVVSVVPGGDSTVAASATSVVPSARRPLLAIATDVSVSWGGS